MQVSDIEAKKGCQFVSAVMLRDVSIASVEDIFADNDKGAIKAAIQQGF